MKKISELMDELGFDPEGSTAVKEAFIKYLIRTSQNTHVLTPTEKNLIKGSPIVRALPIATQKRPSTKNVAKQHSTANQLAFEFMAELSPKSRTSRKSS